MNDMKLTPYVGVGLIRFGMTPEEVDALLGQPESTSTSGRGEREEHRGEITIRYGSKANGVVEISFGSDSGLNLDGEYLYNSTDLTNYLRSKDMKPVECFGFLLYLNLGVATTGFHDEEKDQKSIAVFQKGRWDSMKDSFTPFNPRRYD